MISEEKCSKCADRVMWLCFAGNVFLCIFKGFIGFLSGSLAVVADAVHSGADVLVSIVAIITIHLAKRPPDKTHPYGHGKAEFIGGVFTGVVLLSGGACVIVYALGHLLQRTAPPKPHYIAVVAAATSILVNELLFRWTICAARRVNSAVLEAEGWDNRSDSFSSIPVLIGVIGAQFGFEFLDPLAALFVGVIVGKIGFELLAKNLHGLMDVPLGSDEITRMRKLVLAVEGVEGLDYLRTRGMGRHFLADLQILVDPHASVAKGNAIAGVVREAIQQGIRHVEDVTIVCKPHIEDTVATE